MIVERVGDLFSSGCPALGHPARVGRGAARLEWVRRAARSTACLQLDGLALPRIGAGLGGLDWPAVRAVLEEELAPLPYVEHWLRK